MADGGDIALSYCRSHDDWKLQRMSTGQSCWLGAGDWALHQLDDGWIVRCSRSKAKDWVATKLPDDVRADEDGSFLVYDARRSKVLPLLEYQRQHAPRDVAVRSLGSSTPHILLAFVLEHPVEGGVVFWSLRKLHERVIGNQKITASSWYQNWIRWWRKDMHRIQLPPSHLRKAVVLAKHKESEDLDEAPFRIFQDIMLGSRP